MALQYLLAPTFQFVNTAGKPLSGGAYMEVYLHGTRTKYFCASDFDGTLHPFRIPLDSLGANIVLANDTGSYDVYAYNRYGSLMMSRYNVKPGAGGGIGTITSTDGSIDIHQTADGVDLSVNGLDPSCLKAAADPRATDGKFHFSTLVQEGDQAYVDNEGAIRLIKGWYHFTANVQLAWTAGARNETHQVTLYTTLSNSVIDFDISHVHTETIELSGDVSIVEDGSELVIGVSGLPTGLEARVVGMDVHAITGKDGHDRYFAGSGITISNDNYISADFDEVQEKLVAGQGVTIEGNVISAPSLVQVNSDWNATSGVAEILNKPDLDIYATQAQLTYGLSGKQDTISDLAQIRAGATAGASAVQLSDLATVATTGDYDDLNNRPNLDQYATKTEVNTGLATKQDVISDLATIRSGAQLGATSVQPADLNSYATDTELAAGLAGKQDVLTPGENITISNNVISATPQRQVDWAQSDSSAVDYIRNKPDLSVYATDVELTAGLATKQDTINDLSTIRSGAAAGATALQPSDVATVATTGDYDDLVNKPTIPTETSDLTNDSGFITDADVPVKDVEVDGASVVNAQGVAEITMPDLTGYATTQDLTTGLAGKQDTISDLSAIRSGAQLGSTAVQPADMNTALAGKEDAANKSQTLDPTSTTQFPSSAATASFVNSSVATNTATFRGNFKLPDLGLTYPATDAQIEAALDAHTWPVGVVPTNNDYVYVEIQNPQTTGIDDVVKRFKYNGTDWHYEYTLNNSSFTAAEKAAIDSGIDSAKVAIYDAHVANSDIHVTLSDKSNWNAKQDAISDLSTIRSGAQLGASAVQPGDLASVATSGSYNDLSDKPSIPAAQVNSDWNSSSGVSQILNKPQLSTVATTGDYADLTNKPSIPAAQVNSDWNAVSGVSEILNKPTLATVATTGSYNDLSNKPSIPTATSDLTNDSGFITLSDVPAQAQADWTESDTSDPSYIQNKPTLATVATTGDYTDLTNKPSIPAAQVNADWNSSSGVSEILNKPALATVATSGSYNDLSNKPNIPTATSNLTNDSGFITLSDVPAQVNADWNSSSGASEILNKPTIPSGTQLVPAATSADADKVLTVNAQGTPTWASAQAPISAGDGIDITNNVVSTKVDGTTIDTNASGELTVIGGGGGDGADWDAEQGEPGYIENKPVPKTLTAGTGISITENASTITIANTAPDTVASLPTNLTSAQIQAFKEALGVDETLLWSGVALDATMSELPTNFERIRIEFGTPVANTGDNIGRGCIEVSMAYVDTSNNGSIFLSTFFNGDGSNNNPYYTSGFVTGIRTLSWQTAWTAFGQVFGTTKSTGNSWFRLNKVVGIHRVASN